MFGAALHASFELDFAARALCVRDTVGFHPSRHRLEQRARRGQPAARVQATPDVGADKDCVLQRATEELVAKRSNDVELHAQKAAIAAVALVDLGALAVFGHEPERSLG